MTEEGWARVQAMLDTFLVNGVESRHAIERWEQLKASGAVRYYYVGKEGLLDNAPLPKGRIVFRVNRPDGKRLQGNGAGPVNVLVEDVYGRRFVVPARKLRLVKDGQNGQG